MAPRPPPPPFRDPFAPLGLRTRPSPHSSHLFPSRSWSLARRPCRPQAGVKYSLVVTVSDGQDHYVEVLDQAWRTPRYALLAHEVGSKVARRLKLLGEDGHGIWQPRPQLEEPVKEAKEMEAKEMEK